MVGGLEHRALHEVRRPDFLRQLNLGYRRHLHSMSRPRQEAADIETAVPPKLQMPLLDSGSLVTKPGIGST